METSEAFCGNTHNAVWCGPPATDSDSEQSDSGSQPGRNEDGCVTLTPGAQTGHCSTLLPMAAQQLGVHVADLISFTTEREDWAPTCAAGSDGTFASAQGGLWAVPYRVCARVARSRNLRGVRA